MIDMLPTRAQDSSSETISSDQTLTPSKSISLQTSLAELQDQQRQPLKSGDSIGAGCNNSHFLLSPCSPRSPHFNGGSNSSSSNSSNTSGFFSSFRPSSPKVNLQNQQSISNSAREDATTSFYTSAPRKGIERERDISTSGSEASTRNRRPSSVFDHVGGMLDRFGRRLQNHSRGDSKDDRRRLSNTMLSGSALDAVEGGSSISDEHSPNGSSTHMSPTSTNHAGWERIGASDVAVASSSSTGPGNNGGAPVGLVWSPVMEEGQRHASPTISRPEINRNQSTGSHSEGGSRLSATSSSRSHMRRASVMERTLIQVTEDNERFSVVDISGLNSAAAIKERMMSKLHLFDDDPSCFAVSRTEIGLSGSGGPRMSDDELLALCWQAGDDKGTLKFLLHQIASPSQLNHSVLPPPSSANLSPQIDSRELLHDSNTNTNTSTPTTNSGPAHSKSGSFSSRSSVGDVLGISDQGTGDSGSEASARAGGLHRAKATSRRAGGPSSISSADEIRSPIVSTRSPSQPSTPLLGSVLENKSESAATSTPMQPRPARPERSEKRKGTSPSDSPIEEIRDITEMRDSATSRTGFRRSGNIRPNSSHTTSRTSMHGQWESEVGTSSSRTSQGGSAVPSSPLATQSTLSERPTSRGGSQSTFTSVVDERGNAQSLPKSLTPGGKEPRAIDAADAAHMYLGRSSSPFDETAYSVAYREGAHQQPNQALGIHNVKSVDDMRRRSRPSMPSLSEMPNFRREQQQQQQHLQQQQHQHQQQMYGPPSTPARAEGQPNNNAITAITRQGSADAHIGHRIPPSFGQQPLQINHDYRNGVPVPYPGLSARPRTSVGFERERSTSFGGGVGLPSLQQPGMVPRPGGSGFELVRNSPVVRSGMMASPPMARPMTPAMHPHSFDNRFAPSPQSIPRPLQHYTNEFGARTHIQGIPQQYHNASDPRLMSTPFANSRPHTIHDQQRFRPIVIPPPRPAPSPQPHREDPFANAHFPASNSRTVSEFQRNPNSSLQPGMTVQETMLHQQRQQSLGSHFAPPPRSADPRDVRSMASRQQNRSYDYPYQGPHNNPPGHQQQLLQRPLHYHNASPSPHSASTTPNSSYQPPTRQQPAMNTALRSSNTPAPHHRPHTAAIDGTGPPTERSSGSSFTTISSTTSAHRRNISSEDQRHNSGGWVEETYSTPTSVRSSRSESMGQESKVNALQAIQTTQIAEKRNSQESELPYSSTSSGSAGGNNNLHHRGDSLEEEDLINLRPLPKVPFRQNGVSDASDGEKRNEDEDTLRAAEWKQMLSSLEGDSQDDGSGTARKISSSDLLSPKRSETNVSESSGTSHNTAVPVKEPIKASQGADDAGGTFASFASFDDEDEYDEGGTWAQQMDTFPASTKTSEKVASKDSPSTAEATLRPNEASALAKMGSRSNTPPQSPRSHTVTSPRRPVLTLNIDPTVHNSPMLTENVSPKSIPPTISEAHLRSLSSRDSPRGAALALGLPSPAGNGINRRTSFARRDLDWAFRPPPEQLYDNLDDFFPKHDLDKPVLDNSALPASPQTGSPRTEASAQPLGPTSPAPFSAHRSRFQHKKSIRIVAQDRKKFLERKDLAGSRKADGEGLNRKGSTKLWGTNLVEVRPGADGHASNSSSSIDSPLRDSNAKPVFKWVKGDLIGKGTYGRVYLALNATTGEMIAVKQVELPTTDSDREDARQKGVVSALKSEIETLKDLDHPNIVSYLGFEETTSYLSIFLEYVPGGSVGSCLRKHGKLDEDTIKSFLQQILAGLNYLHNRGILHRDLKADNLLVDFNGIVKISDFGTVRKSEDIYGNIASMSIQGSIFWMAPEVVSLSRAGYSAKVDIWSLGCVVLEMFAGRRPWSDEEAVQAMFKIGAERRAPPIPPDVRLSRAAAHFLKTCFAVDPNSRPTAQRLLEHVFPHIAPGWKFADSSLYRALHR